MKKYNTDLDKRILKILKQNKPFGLTRFKLCKLLGLKTYIYEGIIKLPSGIYYQARELHFKRTTVYEHLKKLLKQGKIEKYSLIDGVGHPKVYWIIK